MAIRRTGEPSRPLREGALAVSLEAGLRRLARSISRARGRQLFVLDAVAVFLAGWIAIVLRYDSLFEWETVLAILPVILLVVGVRLAVNMAFGLYARDWRYASVPELERIVGAVLAGSAISIILFYGMATIGDVDASRLPRSFWVAELVFSTAFVGGARFAIRIASDYARPRSVATDRHAALLYGAGQAGVQVARWARREHGPIDPVGFLDDNPDLAGATIAGLRVYGGIEALGEAAAATGAGTLLITMPSAPGSAVRAVIDAARKLSLDVRTVPSMSDLLAGSVDLRRVRRVRVEDLLRRPVVAEHASGVEDIVSDRVVVVTGAAGSIGSELARQLYALGPRRLILVDRSESPLYLLQRELETRSAHGQGSGELVFHLGNVVSRAMMERLIWTERPRAIFHAAAYKHVPMMEEHPSDAAQVNIGGTLVLLDAAAKAGVEHFVFVSTDKAVDPSNAMGASKRIAEMLVAEAAQRTGRRYVSVRFGNVLGSTGSVVPIFQEQLENDQPLTITHPDMTRFFMTIPEAAWLILDAAALGRPGGDMFVLDMAEPVRIMDLAHDLVRLAGRDPKSQPIEVVGLRPGEKLHEQLFFDAEAVEQTESPKVLRATVPPTPATIRDDVRSMLTLADGLSDTALRDLLIAYANRPDRLRREVNDAGAAHLLISDEIAAPLPSPPSGATRSLGVEGVLTGDAAGPGS